MSLLPNSFVQAKALIEDIVRTTPLEWHPSLGDGVFLKREDLQETGSFKARGAAHKLLCLNGHELEKGVVTASTGNHGKGVAFCASKTRTSVRVFVPNNADAGKVKGMESYGANIVYAGENCVDAEIGARKFSEDTGVTYVSPYNDEEVVLGQGTIGVEIEQQLADRLSSQPLTVYVSVGGGGLIGGIGAYLKQQYGSRVRMVGCQPRHSCVMFESIKAGKVLQDVDEKDTLSDGTAGGIEDGCMTFPLCQQYVDEWVLIDEADIVAAAKEAYRATGVIFEGAANVAIAAYLADPKRQEGLSVVVVCGGNASEAMKSRVLETE